MAGNRENRWWSGASEAWWWRVGMLRAKLRLAHWLIDHVDEFPQWPIVEGTLRRIWGVS